MRLFPDYAGTVLWFAGPVDYQLSGLTPELVDELRDWEQFYYDVLTPELDWSSPELAHQYTVKGNHLAGRVADELGDGYEVEFRSYEPGAPRRRFRGTGHALNPWAVAAFDELVAALRTEQDRTASALTASHNGDRTGWVAYAPLSGTTFKPHQ